MTTNRENRSIWRNTCLSVATLHRILQVVVVHILRSLVGSSQSASKFCVHYDVRIEGIVCFGFRVCHCGAAAILFVSHKPYTKCMSAYSAFVIIGAFRITLPHNTTQPRIPRFIIGFKIGLRAVTSRYTSMHLHPRYRLPKLNIV
jgi:hypothetical protein